MPVQIGQKPDHNFTQPLGLLKDCHRRIEHFLAVLLKVASRARDGEMTADERSALSGALTYFREAAPRHTADEEISLFPRLRSLGSPEVEIALAEINRLEADHIHAARLHDMVDILGSEWLKNGQLPHLAASHLVELLEQLTAIYSAHIELEDTRVFPLAGRVLGADAQQEIGREMAARRAESRTR